MERGRAVTDIRRKGTEIGCLSSTRHGGRIQGGRVDIIVAVDVLVD